MSKDGCPKQVFKRPYRFQLLREFDFAYGRRSSKRCARLRSPLASDTVLLSVLDPDPIAYFYKHFHKINAFYFKAGITEDEYYDIRCAQPRQSGRCRSSSTPASRPIFRAHLVGRCGGKDRREIAVIGLDDPVLANTLIADKGYWMDAETASNGFASMPYRNQEMPEDFRRALIANYGSRADLEKKLGQTVEYPWEKP